MDHARSTMPGWRLPALPTASAWALPASSVALLAFAVLAFSPQIFACGDTSWHLAAGDWILAHRAVPHVDPFSFTFAGRPWIAHEWLAEAIMAATFAAGGWGGLALLFAAALATTLLLIGATLGRHLPPLGVVVALALVATTLSPSTLARPHVLAWGLLALWLAVLLRARERAEAPSPSAALLMLVWANLHASFLFGLALAAALAGEALVARARPAALRGWLGFGLLALAAALATPHGVHGLLFPMQISTMRTLPLIVEWRPTDFASEPGFALLLATGGYALLRWRVKVPPVRALILLVAFWLALGHARHQAIFAIVAAMLLAAPLGAALPPHVAPRGGRRAPALLALAALAVLLARLAVPAVERDGLTAPVTLLARLPATLTRQPVLNDYAYGGPLIRRGIAPYIDGRADMYGDAFVAAHDRIARGDLPGFRAAAARWHLGWTILPPASPLASALDHEPGWRRLAGDRWAVVHVRAD